MHFLFYIIMSFISLQDFIFYWGMIDIQKYIFNVYLLMHLIKRVYTLKLTIYNARTNISLSFLLPFFFLERTFNRIYPLKVFKYLLFYYQVYILCCVLDLQNVLFDQFLPDGTSFLSLVTIIQVSATLCLTILDFCNKWDHAVFVLLHPAHFT